MSYPIDSNEVIDYSFDWTNELAAGETIVSHTVTPSAGLEVFDDTESGGIVTYWVRNATGVEQQVVCQVVTNQDRTMEKTAYFIVTEK